MPRRVVDDGRSVGLAAAPVSPRAIDPAVRSLPLTPGTFDLGVYRGDTYEWVFRLCAKQYDENTGVWTGSVDPLDITGWRFRAEIRPGVDGILVASLQEMARDPLNGLLRMRLSSNQSRNVTGDGLWDLEAVTADGWVRTILRGKVKYLGDVTTSIPPYLRGVG